MKIPENEQENVLSIYWQMITELESQAHSTNDPFKRMLVAGGYNVLNRINFTKARPRWET
jgi:hypothetical protein